MSGGLWRSFGNLTHPSVPVQDWQGAGACPGVPRASAGAAVVLLWHAVRTGWAWLRQCFHCTPPQTTALPSFAYGPQTRPGPLGGAGRDAKHSGLSARKEKEPWSCA